MARDRDCDCAGATHEQQHQELIVTDIVHAFSCKPLLQAYRPLDSDALPMTGSAAPIRRLDQPGGVVRIGHEGADFAFDNESPRHSVLLQPCAITDRLVTCADYASFMGDGGYRP